VARRTIAVNGETWEVRPTGRLRRFTRFTPVGSRGYDAAISELSDRDLLELFRASQPAWTAPEGAYGAR